MVEREIRIIQSNFWWGGRRKTRKFHGLNGRMHVNKKRRRLRC